ncbi:MAG: hypothetical protein OIF54_01170, partial [Cohaesibacter sp.]|nr:hypothetical protein [Cohaesibacter sp.]
NGQMTILSGPGSMSVTGAGRWLVTGLSNSAETKIEIITSAPLVQGNSCALLFYPGAHNSATVGKVFYVKEAMVHVGTNPVPPMPQKGVVAADNISVDLSGLDLSSGFYGVMDIEQIWQDSASGAEKMLQIGLDTANRFDLVRDGDGSVQARFVNNGATIGTTSYSAPRDGSSQKIAFGAGPDYLGHATDNEDYAEDLTMSYRDDLADLMISHSYSGSRNDCLLKSLTLYSGTPTTAKLQELVQ